MNYCVDCRVVKLGATGRS